MNQVMQPSPEHSYWPLFVALGILLLAVGIVSTLFISMFGLILLLTSILGWVIENTEEQEE